jgi:two-component system, LuxR family, sensor kinase FixL
VQQTLIGQESLGWLLAASAEAVLIAGADGRIVMANLAAHRLFGHVPDSLPGQSIDSLVPERMRDAHAGQRAGYGEHPRPRQMGAGLALVARHADGSEFPVEVSLAPLSMPDMPGLVMATVYDIRKRKQAELALQESEARMRAVFETAVDAIITIDEQGRMERMNPAAERLFGYSEAEAVGRNVSMLMPEPHRSAHDGYLAHYLLTGEQRVIGKGREVSGRRKDGSVFPMDLAVAEMRLGTRRMFTGIVRDITERKRAEEHNRALLQELRSANEELSNFAYVVSHDLKAPLRGIGSLADWLASDYADKFTDEGKEHMRLLIQRVHRMGGLIDGILQYSRVGRIREAVHPVALDQLLPSVIDLQAAPPHIAITIDTPLPVVVAEPTRIEQVFHNLISNAIKYMDKPHGDIHIGCIDDGTAWRFYVSDNGPGIEARHFERIFQLFQTLASRDRIESTGVGLSLVKKIVELYQGKVWLESTPGQGTCFWFTLPKAGHAHHE